MHRISYYTLFIVVAFVAAGCAKSFQYDLVQPSEVKKIHPDSLRWKYANGVVIKLPVRDKNDQLLWLDVQESTTLMVTTIEREQYNFRLQTIAIDEKSDGLLGSNTMWRGYDLRSHAERSVFMREINAVKVNSPIPASERILPNQ